MKDRFYTIGQVAKICNIPLRTLWFYDAEGIVCPTYTDSMTGYRGYSSADLLHVKAVQDLRSLDFTINEIRDFIDRPPGLDVVASMQSKRDALL